MQFIDPIILAQIGLGWLLIRYLIDRDRGTKEPASGLWAAGLFGALAVVAAYFLNQNLLPAELLASETLTLPLATAATGSLMVGLIEESAKLLPLAIWLYRKRYFNEVTDGIIYFGIAGMIFGVAENILYSLNYGSEVGLVRIITVPFLHAGFCVCFGWLLARRKVTKGSWWLVVTGYVAAVLLHGLYDFGLFYGAWYTVLVSLALTIAINMAVFKLYGQAERHDRRLGLSASSRENWYCPFCGTPNPNRELHCPKCGRKT